MNSKTINHELFFCIPAARFSTYKAIPQDMLTGTEALKGYHKTLSQDIGNLVRKPNKKTVSTLRNKEHQHMRILKIYKRTGADFISPMHEYTFEVTPRRYIAYKSNKRPRRNFGKSRRMRYLKCIINTLVKDMRINASVIVKVSDPVTYLGCIIDPQKMVKGYIKDRNDSTILSWIDYANCSLQRYIKHLKMWGVEAICFRDVISKQLRDINDPNNPWPKLMNKLTTPYLGIKVMEPYKTVSKGVTLYRLVSR